MGSEEGSRTPGVAHGALVGDDIYAVELSHCSDEQEICGENKCRLKLVARYGRKIRITEFHGKWDV